MQGILHSLQIGTLSTWLSLSTFGTVGLCVHPWQAPAPAPLPISVETEIIPNDFLLQAPIGTPGDALTAAPANALPIEPTPTDLPPAPPELTPLAEFSPLPEIPDIPPPVSAVREAHEPARTALAQSPPSRPTAARPTGSRTSSSPRSGSPTGSATATGSANSPAAVASRLAAGRMPAPAYPPSAKRAGHTGTVVVEFTIGTDGRVISAYAKSACPWASLNEAAVSAVRRWKFPPGGVLKTQRPIIFQLR